MILDESNLVPIPPGTDVRLQRQLERRHENWYFCDRRPSEGRDTGRLFPRQFCPAKPGRGRWTQPLRHNCKEQRHTEQTKGPKDEKRQKAIDYELTSQCLPAQRWQGLQAATKTRTNHKTPDSKALQLSYPRRILLEGAFFLLQQRSSGVEL